MAYERLDKIYKDGYVWDGAAVTRIDNSFVAFEKDVRNLSDEVTYLKQNGVGGASSSYDETTGNLTINSSSLSYDEETGNLTI